MRSEHVYDLDERLIAFLLSVIELANSLPATFAAQHMARQMIRSGTAPALNYAEALAAESRKDFIHKMKTGLKELRETYTSVRIILFSKWVTEDALFPVLDENKQLISIFAASIATAEKNESELKGKVRRPT